MIDAVGVIVPLPRFDSRGLMDDSSYHINQKFKKVGDDVCCRISQKATVRHAKHWMHRERRETRT